MPVPGWIPAFAGMTIIFVIVLANQVRTIKERNK